jgi:hypothetical protein
MYFTIQRASKSGTVDLAEVKPDQTSQAGTGASHLAEKINEGAGELAAHLVL